LNKILWLDRGWQPVHLGFCPSEKAFKSCLKEYDIKQEIKYPSASGFTIHFANDLTGDDFVVVGLKKHDNPLEIVGLIVHEAVHVFDYICEAIGEDEPSDEFKAYSIQMITMMLMKAYQQIHKQDWTKETE
jgi:hypothetical protein